MDTQGQSQIIHRESNLGYRGQSFANLLRMGHCAPTVMQTLLDISALEQEWLVKFSAGMPGGIGNTGFECGAVTSSLAMLGLRYGLDDMDRGLPVVFEKGHALCRRFLECHKTMLCREIRGDDHFPRHCIRPVLFSPELYLEALENSGEDAIPEDIRKGYCKLYAHMVENDFHCAQCVFHQLQGTAPDNRQLSDATSAFMGGTLFMGMTCGALAAGVMALGLRYGEIEDSPLRVIRLLTIMTLGGNAFDERINKFNKSMNKGYRLSRWFVKEFGSTQCRAITGCDFSSPEGIDRYVESDGITGCKEITAKVAEKVQQMLASDSTGQSSA